MSSWQGLSRPPIPAQVPRAVARTSRAMTVGDRRDSSHRENALFSAFSTTSALNDKPRAASDNSDEMPAGIEDNFASSPSLGMAGPWHPADSAFPVRVKMLKPPYARIAIQPHRRSSRLSAFICLQKNPERPDTGRRGGRRPTIHALMFAYGDAPLLSLQICAISPSSWFGLFGPLIPAHVATSGPHDCRLPIEWSPGEGLTTGMLTPK